ncbi:MAG TPA: FAD binding domain-containing protein [Anaerolineales bacterium]|nr:FAD binding domain-containing protein [Anaerolineales bacterium]
MILEYHRPQKLEEALALIARPTPPTFPLGGGTVLTQPGTEQFAVVDLQDLGLNTLELRGNTLGIGAMVRLADLLDFPETPSELKVVIRLEASQNLRQAATVAGTLVSGDGRSPLTCAFLALNAELVMMPGDGAVPLGELLPLREEKLTGKLITEIVLPKTAALFYDQVSRSPADRPLVSAAVTAWPSGRTRVVLGGYGNSPVLVFDGPRSPGAEISARDAYSRAEDAWASGEFRAITAEKLVLRALQSFGATQPDLEGNPV